VRPTPEEVQRLNEEFNEIAARGAAELEAAEEARRTALLALPEGRAAFVAYEEAVTRSQAEASIAQRNADVVRETRTAQAAQMRATEEDAAHTAFLATDPEATRIAARRRADEECSNRLLEVGRRIPPVSGETLDAERRSAFQSRDAAYRAADLECSTSLNTARDALGAAQQAAYWKYVNAVESLAVEHQQALAAVDLALQKALRSADETFANAMNGVPAAVAIEQNYTRTRDDIEQRCEARKQEIYRRLRGEPS
jgi:hypothetical protein